MKITPAARDLLETSIASIREYDAIPRLVWWEGGWSFPSGGKATEKLQPGPAIGFDDRALIPESYIVTIQDVEFATDMPEQSLYSRFEGKVLDVKNGVFVFLDA